MPTRSRKKTMAPLAKLRVYIQRKRFSVVQLSLFALVFALVGGYIAWITFAATSLTIEAEAMKLPIGASIYNSSTGSGGKGVRFSVNGTATATANLPSASSSVSVIAHGNSCYGWASLALVVDGVTVVPTTTTSTTYWKTYNANISLPSGAHSISLKAQSIAKYTSCTRYLYVDAIRFNATLTSAAQVTLTAKPTTIVAGQSATLTWKTSYATSCQAISPSAWTTSTATSGSRTVAPTIATTYVMTCKGSGGSGTAMTTITTQMAAPAGYANKIFEDTFSAASLDSTKWVTQMGGGGTNGSSGSTWDDKGKLPSPYSAIQNDYAGMYNAEYGNPDQVTLNNGLTLSAQKDSTFSSYGYTWKAGYVSTYGKFTFTRGYVQIKAKMPDSSTGAWAGLWFLNNDVDYGGDEIDLQESGTLCSNTSVNYCMASNLHTSGNGQAHINTGVDLSAGYHIYGMEYLPGQSITMYLDGRQVARYTTNIPASAAYEMILTNSIAQNTSGWHSITSSSTPSPLSRPFKVAEVQVWQ